MAFSTWGSSVRTVSRFRSPSSEYQSTPPDFTSPPRSRIQATPLSGFGVNLDTSRWASNTSSVVQQYFSNSASGTISPQKFFQVGAMRVSLSSRSASIIPT